jgi:hypothetical protein
MLCVPSPTKHRATIPPARVRSPRHAERGAGSLRAIIWTVVLLSLLYAGIKIVPILFGEYEFQDGIQSIARFASANGHVEAVNGNVKISADYSIIVDLKVYQLTLNFHPAASNAPLF